MTPVAKKRQQAPQNNVKNLQPDRAQQRASAPDESVWVGASAGSGKTKVLTDRVVRLLLSGVLPQRILCLTFTRAAAAEMAIRVTEQLRRWAVCGDDELRSDLDKLQGKPPETGQIDEARRLFAKALSCPGGMRIHTLHAFGQEVLRRFPLEAGLPPHFAVIEEAEERQLRREAENNLLQAASAIPESPEGLALMTLVRDLGEERFADTLRKVTDDAPRLKKALTKAGGVEGLVCRMRSLLSLEPGDTEESICREASAENAFAREKILRASRLIHEKGTKTYKARAQKILDWLTLPHEARAGNFESYLSAYVKKDGEAYKEVASANVLAEHPEIEAVLDREATRLTTVFERLDTVRVAEQTAAVLTLAISLMDRYAERKAAQAVLDFNDLIDRTTELLTRRGIAEWVLFKLDGGLDHILVDEAQDTNPDQWRIIKALTDEFLSGSGSRPDTARTLFVVGDEKQSIFSFLKADPEEFARMNAYFTERFAQSGKELRKEPLNISFRSAPAVLRAVDAVFAAEAACEGVSCEEIKHFPYHREAPGRVEVWPLIQAPENKKETATLWNPSMRPETEFDPILEMAEQIAAQIKAWIDERTPIYDRKAKQNRPLTYGDIMILLRRRGKIADPLVRALKAKGIPVTGVDRMELTKQLAVMDLMALLQFVLLPEDDLTLATVLRGPLLGCSEDRLMALAIQRKGTLLQSLQEKAGKDPSFGAMRDYLQQALAAADNVTPFAMLARLLSEPCPADAQSGRRALAARLGPDAEDPVDELLNAAQTFGHRHAPSLQAFLHWLIAAETEIKREMDQGAGRVRIATVHGAKGLEAPVVILPDTATKPRPQELPKFLWDTGNLAAFYVPREPAHGYLRGLREQARRKQMEEYRRLLYVALTRASDRLYIVGWGKSEEGSWYSLIKEALKPLDDPLAVKKTGKARPIIVFADPDLYPIAPETRKKANKDISQGKAAKRLPDWAYRVPPDEPRPPRPLVPSRPAEEEPPLVSPQDNRFARGKIIHRLLQSLPEVDPARHEEALSRFLANPQHGLSRDDQNEIGRQALGLLRNPAFAPLFGPGSRAEVPIVGHIGDRYIVGQVDRLCVRDGEVWIVDYKTNRLPPAAVDEVPSVYRRQLAAYSAVLKEVYPEKKIHTCLLWTEGPSLMLVSEDFLPAA